MKRKFKIFAAIVSASVFVSLALNNAAAIGQTKSNQKERQDKVVKTEKEWQKILTPEQYKITCKKGTEVAFTGKYYHFNEEGIYECVRCGNPLFRSDEKYDSGSGWPSFWKPIDENSIILKPDNSLFSQRTEVLCGKCGAHLGHVFNDGPQPTGKRYCVNSVALEFKAKEVK